MTECHPTVDLFKKFDLKFKRVKSNAKGIKVHLFQDCSKDAAKSGGQIRVEESSPKFAHQFYSKFIQVFVWTATTLLATIFDGLLHGRESLVETL